MRQLPQEVRKNVLSLLQKGKSVRYIARKLGIGKLRQKILLNIPKSIFFHCSSIRPIWRSIVLIKSSLQE